MKRVGAYSGAWLAYECNGRAFSLGETPYPTRTIRELECKEAGRPARTHSRLSSSDSLATWKPVWTSCRDYTLRQTG